MPPDLKFLPCMPQISIRNFKSKGGMINIKFLVPLLFPKFVPWDPQ
jgi:hypothetical protein